MNDVKSLIERYFAALNAGDKEAVLALLDDDVVLDTRAGIRHVGKDQFRSTLSQMNVNFRESYRDVVIMVEPNGIRGAAECTLSGTYEQTKEGLPEANGQSYSVPGGMFFEVEDGLITRVTAYHNPMLWDAALRNR
ncbi:hypothetical protein GCM10011385_24960 [Nitratireductor aestuarii]|jgi:steroid delta-isomerase-like uncharacterized protein|uniref:SnoaL-like domain-containing protein n=1 Tax=Nitratireductor aestuarii TaxID=1735103 RepID=A0A916W650_9HYPH|nr:ketosteroid isomerase-related protein [Nitratireductor aestuarii]GGA70150.1 hypothetical protein GCM10011385_24960 [Nitratireductor aestuarii]